MKWAWLVLLVAVVGQSAAQGGPTSPSSASSYVPVHKFDPKRDPAADLRAAMGEAQRTGKRIILDVGGDWCVYCHQLDRLFEQHPELARLRDENFVTLAVFYGKDNKNPQFFAHYEKIQAIPQFYVLDEQGRPLPSQNLIELRDGGTYSPEKMKTFLLRWSPATDKTATNQ